jgi:hypothetical protein
MALRLLLGADSIGLPLFEHARQTLKTELSTIIFFLLSACFPHNSQKETMFLYLNSNLLVFSISLCIESTKPVYADNFYNCIQYTST